MERRAFIRSTCNICGLLAAGIAMPTLLSSCGPAAYKVIHAPIHNNLIEIPLDGFTQAPFQLVRPEGWFYSIAVRKKEDNTWSALLLKCTHQDNQLNVSPNGYTCSLHGSAFSTEGHVTKPPAERALRSYPVTAGPTSLTIDLKA